MREKEVRINVGDNGVAMNILGQQDKNLKFIEEHSKAKIVARGNEVVVSGDPHEVELAEKLFHQLASLAQSGQIIDINLINYTLNLLREEQLPLELLC